MATHTDDRNNAGTEAPRNSFDSAETGALAHLYRGEMFRSKIWRTRLDTTTNWAVVTTGIALSLSFSGPDASPLPLIMVSLLVMVFLGFEARRYRYFDIWRSRVRVMELYFYGPLLRGRGISRDSGWADALADDYLKIRFHISYWEALGRRLRRNYVWIFMIQFASYLAKLAIHPGPAESLGQLAERAALGPLPGTLVLSLGVVLHLGWIVFALVTMRQRRAFGEVREPDPGEDRLRLFVSDRG